MNIFRRIRRVLALTMAWISASVILSLYLLTLQTESDTLHSLSSRWLSMNLSEIIRPEEDTVIIAPRIPVDVCIITRSHQNEQLHLIIMVVSTPAKKDARKAIRETWANQSVLPSNVKVLFFLGMPVETSEMDSMNEEASMYGDIVIEDFVDSYENLTLKSLFCLKWIFKNCEGATHLLKTDDDMLIRVDKLLEKLTEIESRINVKLDDTIKNFNSSTNSEHSTSESLQLLPESYISDTIEIDTSTAYILGYLYQKPKPIRDKASKWFMPYELYPDEYFPDFISGTAYILTGGKGTHEITKSILKNSFLAKPALPLEDVFITGIIANQRMGIPLLEDNKQFHKTIPLIFPWSLSTWAACFYRYSIAIHGLNANEIRKIWNLLSWINKEKCDSMKGYFYSSLYMMYWSLIE